MPVFKTLKGQVLLLSVGCLVAGMAALAAVNFLTARSQAYAALTAQSRALARSHTEALRDWAQSKAAMVASLAAVVDEADASKPLRMLQNAGSFLALYLGYADQHVVFSGPQNLPTDYDPASRPWYRQAAASQQAVLTAPYVDAGGNGLVVTFAKALREGDSIKAVAAGDVSMAAVVANVASIKPTPASYAFLVGVDGNTIAHPDVTLALQPAVALSPQLTPAVLQALAKKADLSDIELGGRAMLLAVAPVTGTPWLLAIATDRGEALAPLRTLLQVSLGTGAVLLLVLAGILAQRMHRLTPRDLPHRGRT